MSDPGSSSGNSEASSSSIGSKAPDRPRAQSKRSAPPKAPSLPVSEEQEEVPAYPERESIPLSYAVTPSCEQVLSLAAACASDSFISPIDLFRGFYELGRTQNAGVARWLHRELGPDLFPPAPLLASKPSALSQTVDAALAKAAAIRARTGGADKLIHARILLYSLLTLPDAWPSIDRALSGNLEPLTAQLRAFIERNRDQGEQLAPWRAIFAEEQTPASRRENDRVPTQSDDPATLDQLGRRGFAVVLAQHIRNFRKSVRSNAQAGAFMMLVDGPWGSGKSSVLNLLTAELTEDKTQPWIIVNFNAWQHQRTRPPWWSLIKDFYTTAQLQLEPVSFLRAWNLRRRWRMWHLRHIWSSTVIAVGLLLLALASLIALNHEHKLHLTLPIFDTLLKIVSGAAAVGATFYGFAQAFFFGSAKAAQSLTDLRSDPMRPVINLFTSLHDAIGHPVVVYIDDLDRCTSDYVVELLEGIQTLLRTRPIVYVIAADRKWICSSFEKIYTDFNGSISEPGRPLGYLFLDKVFQLTASLPRISTSAQQTFWNNILAPNSDRNVAVQAKEKIDIHDAEHKVANLFSQEDLMAEVSRAAGDPLKQQALQVAAARQITKAEAQQIAEHRLKRFADLLESNPRSIKRLANAYSLHQATHLLQGRTVPAPALARWTILELRWPLLADFLTLRPDAASLLNGTALSADMDIPENLKPLFTKQAVRTVARSMDDQLGGALDEITLRQVLGLSVPASESATPPASPPPPPA